MAETETPQLEVVEIPDVEEAARRAEPLPDALPILPLRETGPWCNGRVPTT